MNSRLPPHKTRGAVSVASVVSDLRGLGLATGARVVVHASMRALGPVEGGADGVVDALQEIVGPTGLLLLPSFNHGAPFARGGAGVFDPRTTKSENGALADCFWRRPGVLRSLHPTHPFAAWGAGAAEILQGHDTTLTLGPDSPLGRLHRAAGHLLHLGTNHEVSTAKHLAETLAHAPCLGFADDRFPVLLPGGRLVTRSAWRYRGAACPLTDCGDHVEKRLAAENLERHGTVGYAPARLIALDDFVRAVLDLLRTGAGDVAPCRSCSIRPGRAEGDWDC